jgi:hypothetical protein
MDEPRDDLLPRSTFSSDENLRIASRGVMNFFLERKNCGTCPNKLSRLHERVAFSREGNPDYAVAFGTKSREPPTKCPGIALL